jgi:hypothetical protein
VFAREKQKTGAAVFSNWIIQRSRRLFDLVDIIDIVS